jgi:hypothetical protein
LSNNSQLNTQQVDQIVNCAKSKVGTPYDADMDPVNHGKIFCAELIIACYEELFNLDPVRDSKEIEKAFPTRSNVRDESGTGRIFEYINKLGVNSKEYIAPGDLLSSPLVQPVAEYRNTDNLLGAWALYFAGQLFMDQMEIGRKVDLTAAKEVLTFFAGRLNDLAQIVTLGQYSFVPESFKDDKVLGYLFVMQKKIFDPIMNSVEDYHKKANTNIQKTMMDANLIDVYAVAKFAMDNDPTVKRNFKFENK